MTRLFSTGTVAAAAFAMAACGVGEENVTANDAGATAATQKPVSTSNIAALAQASDVGIRSLVA
jgi:hypothetical protein